MIIDDGILRQILRQEAEDHYVGSGHREMLESLIERLDRIVSAQPNLQPVKPVADPTEGGRGFAIGGPIGELLAPHVGETGYPLPGFKRRQIHGTCEYEAWNHLAHAYGTDLFFCDGDVSSPPGHELMTVADTIKHHAPGGPVRQAPEFVPRLEDVTQPEQPAPHAYKQTAAHADHYRVVVDFGGDEDAAERFTAWYNDGDWASDDGATPAAGEPVPAGPTAEQAAAMQGIDLTAGTMTLPLEEAEPDVSGGGVPYKPVTIDDIKQDPASVYHPFEGDPETEHFCKWCDASQYAEQHKPGGHGRVPVKPARPLDEYPPPKQD